MKLPVCLYKNSKITNLKKKKKKKRLFYVPTSTPSINLNAWNRRYLNRYETLAFRYRYTYRYGTYRPIYIYIIYLYGPMVSRPLWGLSPNLITPSPSPGLTPPLSPFGQMISISSHPPSHPSSYPVNCSLRSEVIAQSYSFSVAR